MSHLCRGVEHSGGRPFFLRFLRAGPGRNRTSSDKKTYCGEKPVQGPQGPIQTKKIKATFPTFCVKRNANGIADAALSPPRRGKRRTKEKHPHIYAGASLLLFNQRLPILPGCFHPSTFGVCELNCCVRHGNRWILTAIVTEFYVEGCSLKTIQKKSTESLCLPVLVRFFVKCSFLSQDLDLLVPVCSMRRRTSTPGLSTSSSLRDLTHLRDEKSHLKAGFTLRCFQRLSVPDAATQPYRWRDNWYTVDPSTPVLSY